MNPAFEFHKLNARGIERAKNIATDFDSLLLKILASVDGEKTRELALAITKLEEACFFAKKAMASCPVNQSPEEAPESKARRMFEAYNAQGPNPNKTWDGKEVPAWTALNDQVRGKWIAAAQALMVAMLLFPLGAFAQSVLTDSVTQVAPPNIGQLLAGFLTPGGLASVLALVGSIVATFVWLTARRKKLVAIASYYAFHIVEDVGAEIEGDDAWDKTARYLREVDAYMVAKGWRPLKPGEIAAVKLEASALHGMEVAKTKIAEAAAVAQAEAITAAATPPVPFR